MRTTLSLDPDVATLLERVRKAKRSKLRVIVNEALRHGLAQMLGRPTPKRTFETKSVNLGRCLAGSLDDISEALALGEGDSHR
jgi:hypothetical protein